MHQTSFLPSPTNVWGSTAGYVERLAEFGLDCPVASNLAVSQWLQRAWDSACDSEGKVKKQRGEKPSSAERVSVVSWVNYKLNDADKAQFSAWDPDKKEVEEGLMTLVSGFYRLTFAWDNFNGAAMCSVVCQAKDDPNFGKGYSTFARDWETLITLTLFKHFVLFQRTWPSVVETRGGEDFG